MIVPKFLLGQGIRQLIAPLETRDCRLWVPLEGFDLILNPFVEGVDAVNRPLSPDQWVEFGCALRKIHSVVVPAHLQGLLGRETYPASGREIVRNFLERAHTETFSEPTAARVAALLKDLREEIARLVDRTEVLAHALRQRSAESVLCHADIFAANLLIDDQGRFFIIDWDNPILAPKERDLMFIGAGVCGVWNTPAESALFYQGYGQVEIGPVPLTYYRCESIIQDIAVYCAGLFSNSGGPADRERDFRFLKSNFDPRGVLEIARAANRMDL